MVLLIILSDCYLLDNDDLSSTYRYVWSALGLLGCCESFASLHSLVSDSAFKSRPIILGI